ncbi:hypothetical protein ACMDB5_03035 [Flavobacterium sp. W1B]|uniref:hypothetical protein n=1 Tax=Flavobacterium sp. W1B TaxID=3394146 RepID=UPI0039BCC53B
MKEIKQIYYNDSGTSFYWRKENEIVIDKIQLIFRETGFYFNKQELELFKNCIEESFLLNNSCEDCKLKNHCTKFLLKTPCSQIDLAVSMEELNAVKDLVEGTLFKINLDDYLYGVGMN